MDNLMGQVISAPPPVAPNIYQRLNAVMKAVRGVGKHSTNKHGNYNYVGHEAITDAVRDEYVKHGVVRTASVIDHQLIDGGTVMVKVRVGWVCMDNPSSRLDVEMVAVQPTQTKSGGLTAQQMGQAVSYAVKNAELKCLSLTGDDTPDSDESDPNGPRDEGPSNDRSIDNEPYNSPEAVEAQGLLAQYSDCKDVTEVKALKALLMSKWPTLRVVPNLADQIQKCHSKAMARVRESVSPEQDGR